MLNFQRLDVYQRAIEFLVLVTEVAERTPKGHAERLDQRWSAADSSKHYKIARGEAMECAASLDVLRIRSLIPESEYARGIELLEAVVSMLTKML